MGRYIHMNLKIPIHRLISASWVSFVEYRPEQMEPGFREISSFVCSFPVGLERLVVVWML